MVKGKKKEIIAVKKSRKHRKCVSYIKKKRRKEKRKKGGHKTSECGTNEGDTTFCALTELCMSYVLACILHNKS